MTAVVIESYGGEDVVQIVDAEVPEPGEREVRVRVRAAGVNPVDWKIRGGLGERLGLTLPVALGGEIAGVVDAVGPGVDGQAAAGLRPGDAVYGIIRSGGFAEFALAGVGDVSAMPAGLEFEEAAAIPLGGLTAWQALFEIARLERGERLLVAGASGGVGSMAVQLARAAGAHVTGTASGRNEAYVRGLGADAFVDYTSQDVAEVVRDADVVLDAVGGETYRRSFRSLKRGGRLVTAVEFPAPGDGAEQGVTAARVFCTPNAEQLAAITRLVEGGQVRAHVAAVLPLVDVNAALRMSESGRTRGKIVLSVGA